MSEIYTGISVKIETRTRFRKAKEDMILTQQIPVGSTDNEAIIKLLDLYEQVNVAKTVKVTQA